MKKLKKRNEMIIDIKTESLEDFFNRGREAASLLDKGKKLAPRRIISFEDPEDLVKFITKAKLILIAAIRKKPNSISQLASQLHRSRASIDKDVQMLESIGIVESEYVRNPGHGRRRIVKAIDSRPIKLRVETVI